MRKIGFEPLALDRVGLQEDGVRRRVPPRELVHVSLDRPPAAGSGGRPAAVRLIVENPGDRPAAGVVCVGASRGGAEPVQELARHRYRLAAGTKETVDIPLAGAPEGSFTILAWLDGEDYARCRLR